MVNFQDENTTIIENESHEIAIPLEKQELSLYKQELRNDPSVVALTDLIKVDDGNTVLTFGQKPSEEISRMSDRILSTMKAVKTDEASNMLTQLTKLMDKFDLDEIKEPENYAKQGFLAKLRRKISLTVEDLFAKYDDLGKEVDEIYKILHQYELDIKKSNNDLKIMFDSNVEFYKELERYIVAGEIAQEQIDDFSKQLSANPNIPEQEKQMKLQQLTLMKEMLSQRVYDLQIAENVAMQTVPMLQTMQMSNFNLMRKINSSFIITLPIFKQCLVQAIQLKRQEIQAKSLQQLDEKTNELLLRNADNTAKQSIANARLSGTSSIQYETLQKTYDTIKKGIEETKEVNRQIAEKRKHDSIELEKLKLEQKNGSLTALPYEN